MTEEVKSGVKPVVLGGLLAVVVAIIALMFLPKTTPAPQSQADAPAELNQSSTTTTVEATPEVEPEVVAAPAATPELAPQEDTPSDTALADPPAPAPEAQADIATLAVNAPSFDTFRVETNGAMVIAGRAEPNQTVDIILGGEMIERVTADGSGGFVALPMASPSDQPRRLSLLADPEGAAIASNDSFIVAPIAAPVVVAAAPAAQEQPAVEDIALEPAALDAPELSDAPVVADVAPAAPPTVLQASEDGVRVVQGGASQEVSNVAIDAITYDPQGEVQLAGRATGDGAVQVYIDNQPLTASPIDESGDWRIDLPDIDTGVYTLRVDEVDAAGDVVSRVETPFKREEPQDVAAVLAEETAAEGFEVAVKTVQPGATLWAIAEESFGSGIFYVEVFEANSDLIRDPDLIYPGQIFRMPEISQ